MDVRTPASLSPSSGLPEAVRSTADEVRRLAIECDFAALGSMATSGIFPDNAFVLDHDVPFDIAAADWWRAREARGEPVMRELAGILTLEPYRFDYEGEPTGFFFPRFCRSEQLSDGDWASLEPVYGAERVASWRATNAQSDEFRDSYVGGRCAGFAIDDGHWTGLFTLVA
jgi:hypothetical protein